MQPERKWRDRHRLFHAGQTETGNGWARLADAYAASGRMAEALDAARNAWASRRPFGDATSRRSGPAMARSFTRADHDRRVDALLFAKRPTTRRASSRWPRPDTAGRVRRAGRHAARRCRRRQPLSVGDRLGHQRCRADDGPRPLSARQQLRPVGPATRGANSQFHLSPRRSRALLRIAGYPRQRCGRTRGSGARPSISPASSTTSFRPDSGVADQSLWRPRRLYHACVACRQRRARPAEPARPTPLPCSTATPAAAVRSRSRPRATYWAGRAALAAGQIQTANSYFQRAAAYPELFYGQLALERLGRNVSAPPQAPAAIYDVDSPARRVQ